MLSKKKNLYMHSVTLNLETFMTCLNGKLDALRTF